MRKKTRNPNGGPLGGRRMWRLNRRTMRHNPAHTRKAGRGFLRRSTVEPWGAVRRGRPRQRARNRGRNQTEGSNRQFRFCWAEFTGQFVVFPIAVCYIGEVEWEQNFEGCGKPRHLQLLPGRGRPGTAGFPATTPRNTREKILRGNPPPLPLLDLCFKRGGSSPRRQTNIGLPTPIHRFLRCHDRSSPSQRVSVRGF